MIKDLYIINSLFVLYSQSYLHYIRSLCDLIVLVLKSIKIISSISKSIGRLLLQLYLFLLIEFTLLFLDGFALLHPTLSGSLIFVTNPLVLGALVFVTLFSVVFFVLFFVFFIVFFIV